MIQGLEYEDPASSSAAGYGGSPSVDNNNIMQSPQHQQQPTSTYNNNDAYHVQQLHRRRPHNGNGYTSPQHNNTSYSSNNNNVDDDKYSKSKTRIVRKLDIFPKTDREMTVRTERGGQLTAVGYILMAILILAEYITWRGMNGESLEHIVVDTR